ncbi:MAG: imidazoleglycerol-phosphate dehydratase HisB [Oscillospiraceae bacterium]|jgi:imidazoleglycerol-phosphate dehydratase|nr:imidazoleglycerol-phosphate dehydratase HisB [Oscillospiraceae bacterium]
MKISSITRETKETKIKLTFPSAESSISTGIGFFDHMLTAMTFYAGLPLELSVTGDLNVDAHHTVEDAGIALGDVLTAALGDKLGIRRFAHAYIPMDEALAFAALDICGRVYVKLDADFPQEAIGEYDSCLTEEFLRAFCQHAGITLHAGVTGKNAHHMTEALFKALGVALGDAVQVTGSNVTSTKGVL